MTTKRQEQIADFTARCLVTAAFLAVAIWFVSLVPAAIDHSLAAQDAKVAAHMEMLKK